VSEQNRAFFAQHIAPERVSNIATGVDINYFQPRALPSPAPSITFTGSMDWMPNQDGIRFFRSEILPRVHAQVPDAELWIVGRCPSREVQSLASGSVHVTGRVQDVRPYLEKSPVYVVPLRFGSGTRIKIFEAMAMGRAVVSTALGAEGLPVKHGENILIADRPDQFADSVVRLLKNPEYAAKIGRAGRALVESQFSWSAVAEQFTAVLQGVAGARVPLKSKAG